jgi:hypothetical protein
MFRKKRKLEFYDFCHAASVINCIGGVIVTMLESETIVTLILIRFLKKTHEKLKIVIKTYSIHLTLLK